MVNDKIWISKSISNERMVIDLNTLELVKTISTDETNYVVTSKYVDHYILSFSKSSSNIYIYNHTTFDLVSEQPFDYYLLTMAYNPLVDKLWVYARTK